MFNVVYYDIIHHPYDITIIETFTAVYITLVIFAEVDEKMDYC